MLTMLVCAYGVVVVYVAVAELGTCYQSLTEDVQWFAAAFGIWPMCLLQLRRFSFLEFATGADQLLTTTFSSLHLALGCLMHS